MCGILSVIGTRAQYAPAAGSPGSNAIYKDSSIIAYWADSIFFDRGYIAINDSSLGLATVGDENSATGKALENGVLSLGDGGTATAFFSMGIENHDGFDFAVFENGFEIPGDPRYHMELAYVEVSIDGIHFFRFPNYSLSQDSIQTGNFEGMYPEQIDGLAGKFIAGYGTPFDLDILNDSIGNSPIYYIRIRDVVGALDNRFCNYDSEGRKINDPWPSAFASSGFDLDAIAVLHKNATGLSEPIEKGITIYPNPVIKGTELHIDLPTNNASVVKIYNAIGQCMFESNFTSNQIVIPANFAAEFLIIECKQNKFTYTTKMIQQ